MPARLAVLDRLPLTPNGKVDRSALPDLAGAHGGPSTELERELTSIVGRVLGIGQVSVGDRVFGLGGNSLHAVEVLAELRARFAAERCCTISSPDPTSPAWPPRWPPLPRGPHEPATPERPAPRYRTGRRADCRLRTRPVGGRVRGPAGEPGHAVDRPGGPPPRRRTPGPPSATVGGGHREQRRHRASGAGLLRGRHPGARPGRTPVHRVRPASRCDVVRPRTDRPRLPLRPVLPLGGRRWR